MITIIPSLCLQSNKYLLLLMALVLSSCLNSNNTSFVKKEYHKIGNLKSEVTYINDSVKEGKAYYYNISGILEVECFYKQNRLDSTYKEYYPDGTLKLMGSYALGEPIGSVFFYFPNGNLELYNVVDFVGETFYVVKYDTLGQIVKEEGVIISPKVECVKIKPAYKIGDTISLRYCIAEPPNSTVEIVIGVYKNVDGMQGELIEPFKNYSIENSIVNYSIVVKERQDFKVVCKGSLMDNLTDEIEMDSVNFDFNVQ